MEEKINVAAILKDKPKGTKLYSDTCCGECVLNEVSENAIYVDMYNKERFWDFSVYGTIYAFPDGAVLLYPSKEMRDWRKFAWKKGDVLVSNDGKIEVIFEKFGSDTYQSFIGKHHLDSLDENLYYQDGGAYPTASFNIETEDAAQTYIYAIEELLGGKLNRETLEIEKPAFKIGKLYVFKDEDGNVTVIGKFIGKNESDGTLVFGKQYEIETEHFIANETFYLNRSLHDELREATEDEAELFNKHYSIWIEKEKEAWRSQTSSLSTRCW